MKKWDELIIYAEIYSRKGKLELILRKRILDKDKIEFVLNKMLQEKPIPASIEVRDHDLFMEKLKRYKLIEKK